MKRDDTATGAGPRTPRRRAVFLDRDGVLNVDHGFVATPERFEWVPGAVEAVRLMNELGYLVIVTTNQSGIGRGLYGAADFRRLMDWANEQLEGNGAHFDAVYHCPHHPTDGVGRYRVECGCRKPAPGMIQTAAAEWDIDLASSLAIGDAARDVEAAEAAGVRAHLFSGGNLLEFVRPLLSDEEERVSA